MAYVLGTFLVEWMIKYVLHYHDTSLPKVRSYFQGIEIFMYTSDYVL